MRIGKDIRQLRLEYRDGCVIELCQIIGYNQSLNKEKDTAFKAVSKIRNHEFRLHDY